jgi:hypothetical protein
MVTEISHRARLQNREHRASLAQVVEIMVGNNLHRHNRKAQRNNGY